jgi:hypothetical protein
MSAQPVQRVSSNHAHGGLQGSNSEQPQTRHFGSVTIPKILNPRAAQALAAGAKTRGAKRFAV